jgi:hypothetical protein
MYATVGIFSMDPSRSVEHRQALHDRIIPMVRQQPAFVSGYWNLEAGSARSYAYLVWQSEADARRFTELLRQQAEAQARSGVTLDSITVVELIASAQA